MTKFIFGFFLILSFIELKSQGLEAYFSYGVFNNPNHKPYVEAYLNITGRSIQWVEKEGLLKSNVEITIVLWNDTNIISFSKDLLQETTKNDSTSQRINLTYLQRMEAIEGKLRVQIRLDDLNDTVKAFETGTFIEINFPTDSTTISSIMAVKSFEKTTTVNKTSKSGYDLIPNIFNYYPTSEDIFTFYTEIYPGKNLPVGAPFLAIYYLKNHESDLVLPGYKGFKRMTASKANILLNSFNIKKLYSGNFDFIIEVRDTSNQLLSSQIFFLQRENANAKMEISEISSINIGNTFAERITSKDTLTTILNSMNPISSDIEKEFVKNLIARGEIYSMQQYLLSFWEQRNMSEPEAPFKAYMQEVTIAEQNFKTWINHGYETDRGRVYLQYGPPNTITQNYNEPSAYPYEIWHYYNLKNQRNRKFVFYNSDLATNDFTLLHSDAIGEPNNHQWRIQLRGRDTNYRSIDQTGEEQSDWGSKYNEWYNEPR